MNPFLSPSVYQADDAEQTRLWFQTLQFYTQSLGGWRRRRKGLANIMVDPKVVPPQAEGIDPHHQQHAHE